MPQPRCRLQVRGITPLVPLSACGVCVIHVAMQEAMNAISMAEDNPALGGAQLQPAVLSSPGFTLPPWRQLALLVRQPELRRAGRELHPRLVLRGNRSYLRKLRAAEQAAWEAAR